MAPRKTIVVVLADAQPKKSVTRFNAAKETDALQNAYISNDALKKIGDPEKVKVTIEAA